MKIKDGFILRKVADNYIIVPTGNARLDFDGMITFNATGALIWRALEDGLDEHQIVQKLRSAYSVDAETAACDVGEFLKKLREAGLLE